MSLSALVLLSYYTFSLFHRLFLHRLKWTYDLGDCYFHTHDSSWDYFAHLSVRFKEDWPVKADAIRATETARITNVVSLIIRQTRRRTFLRTYPFRPFRTGSVRPLSLSPCTVSLFSFTLGSYSAQQGASTLISGTLFVPDRASRRCNAAESKTAAGAIDRDIGKTIT